MNKEVVSIIMPIFNAKKTLNKSVKSLINQTYKNIEIVLVDDGSTDKSGKLCDNLAKKDGRIKVIHQQNSGGVVARKNGVLASTGTYVCFCDADDLFFPNTVELFINNIGDTDCCVGNYARITSKERQVKRKPTFTSFATYSKEDIFNNIVNNWFILNTKFNVALWGALFKRELILNAFLNNTSKVRFFADDLVITLQYYLNVNKFNVIPYPVYQYRMGGYTTNFNNYDLRFKDLIALHNTRLQTIKDANLDKKLIDCANISLIQRIYEHFHYIFVHTKFSNDKKLEIIKSILTKDEVIEALNTIDAENNVNFNLMKAQDYKGLYDKLTAETKMNPIKKLILKIIAKIFY